MFSKDASDLICIQWGFSKFCDSYIVSEDLEFGQANVVFDVKFNIRRAVRSSIRVR